MSSINYIDLIILLPIIYGLVRGFLHGFVRELTSIIAIAIGVVAAKMFAPQFAVKILEVLNMPDWLGKALAYVLLFVGVSLFCQALGKVLQKFLKAISLNWLNKLAGGTFGGLKWALIMSVILNLLTLIDPYYELFNPEAKKASQAYQPTLRIASITWDKANALLPVAREQLGK